MTVLNHSVSVTQRVDALLERMTTDQKLGQMIMAERASTTPDDVREHGLGSVLSGGGSTPGANHPADWVTMNDAYWAGSMAEDDGRLPIPLLYAIDAIHGNANVLGATVFPHNIGLGAAHDPDLIERVAQVCAREVLATGLDWTFAPTLAVVGNVHWGRTYESFSEDPALVASYADRYVRGLQGDLGRDSVIACAKHWVGDGGTANGEDQGNTTLSEAELDRVHIAPYDTALNAGVLTVMASFNSWNTEKCHGHRYLLTDVLKQRMNFEGIVVSDWDGIDQLSDDYDHAIVLSVNAGMDMIMISVDWQRCLDGLKRAVAVGAVPMERIDDAVRRILSVKIRYGLFERPRPADRPWSNHDSFGSAAHREVAREAVRKSLVLLKNDRAILPVAKQARVLVAGKNADNRGHQCGGFTVAWQGVSGAEQIIGGTSIWEGIRTLAPQAVLSVDGSAADAAQHDVAIVVIGEVPYAEGMGDIRTGGRVASGSGFGGPTSQLSPYGRTVELSELHPEDLATIRAIAAKGIPVATVLVSGRPLVVNHELAESAAFVAAWLPGSEGHGVADVLFGDHDFQGTLSFTWPERPMVNPADAGVRFSRGFGLRYR